jgi:hypothetical protein
MPIDEEPRNVAVYGPRGLLVGGRQIAGVFIQLVFEGRYFLFAGS